MTDETPPEKSEIELVYEPGFGSTGSLKENIMVENPIGVYSFNEKTQSQVQKIVANQGINGNPVEALGIVDLKKQKLTKQVHAALNSAMGALIGQPDYPKTSLPQLIQISPVAITALEGSIIETETGIKLDQAWYFVELKVQLYPTIFALGICLLIKRMKPFKCSK